MTELNFKGKEFVYNHHLSVPVRPLEPHPDKGIGEARLDGNLIIQGDNLHALKALLPYYAGKVDCIFIDPPYNTGNEGWAYNDNVRAPMIQEWLEANPIGIEDGLRHDKWCAMMWPRLRLLHELLAEDGTILITLDDNEIHRARGILDEIFGETNFICKVIVQSNKRGQTYKQIAKTHEYLLIYGKSEFSALREMETEGSNLPQEDEFGSYQPRELRNRNPKFGKHNRPNLFFPFYAREDKKDQNGNYVLSLEQSEGAAAILPFNSSGIESCWRWGTDRSEDRLKDETTEFLFGSKTKTGEWRVFEKYRKETVKSKTIWNESKHISEQGTVELGEIGLADQFQFPKPLGLIEDVLALAVEDDALILDSFSGSGTTAHAVLEANKRDDGSRKFILVEMEDYADRLTAERMRRVINGYDYTGTQKTELLREKLSWSKLQKADKLTEQVEKIENLHGHEYDAIKKTVKDGELIVTGETKVEDRAEGLGGEFTYCTLGPAIELDKILTGKTLPAWDALGSILFHMATNKVFDPKAAKEGESYLGQADTPEGKAHVWLIYQPDLDWLKSPEAALTLSFSSDIAKSAPDDRHIVFAPARHVSRKMLDENALKVEFAPLPFALYRMERDA